MISLLKKIRKRKKLVNHFEIIPDQQTPKVLQELMSEDYIKEHRGLFLSFLEFAKEQRNAVGLAANQCALNGERFNQRIFAHRDTKTGIWQLIIDPVVLGYLGRKEAKLEGCLTWIGKAIVAERFPAVLVGYYDIDGNLVRDKIFNGFDAQIFQHEYNHIEGIPEEIVDCNYKLPAEKKPGRNDKCPCGSGKKYKQCCMIYEE